MTFPTVSVQFSPTTGPFDTPTWIELGEGGPHGNRVWSLEWTDGKQADLEQFAAGEATIVLRNDDRLFDPEHASGTYYGDLNPRVPFRIRATHNAVTYDLFYGFVEDGWEQTYAPPDTSTCTVQLVDLLGMLSGYRLPGVLEAATLALNPAGYWPLTEPAGSTAAADRVGVRDGRAVNEPVFGESPIAPGLGTSVKFGGTNDRIDLGKTPTITNYFAVTVMAVIRTPIPAEAQSAHIVFMESDSNANSDAFVLYVETDGTVALVSTEAGLGYAYNPATTVDDNAPHLIFAIGAPSGSGGGMAIDSATVVTTAGGTGQAGMGGAIGGTPSGARGYDDNYFEGLISHVAVFNDILNSTELGTLLTGYASLAGETSGAAIEWVLTQIGVPAGMFDLDAGVSIMAGTDTAGRDALELMREIADTEQGGLYVAHHDGGKLRFRDRYASFQDTRSTATQATFSDDGTIADTSAARVVPGSLTVEPNGVSTVINQASVSWAGGTEIVDESVGSPYGPRPVSIDTQSATPAIARGIGQWVIALNGTPRARIRKLGINPGSNHDEFAYALGTRIADRVAYRSIPQNTGSATTKALEVLGRHHRVEGVEWETDFYLAPSPNVGVVLFTLGTSELGDPDVLGY